MASPGNIIRAAVSVSMPNASVAQLVFWWVVSNQSIGNDDVVDLIEDWFVNTFVDGIKSMMADSVTYVDAEIDRMFTSGTVAENLGTAIIGVSGSEASQAVSAAVAAYMRADTANPKTRGSKYIPGLCEEKIADGALTASALTDLGIALLDYLSDIEDGAGGLLVPGVLSRTAEAFVPFLGTGSITDVPAYQRRRKPNVGS